MNTPNSSFQSVENRTKKTYAVTTLFFAVMASFLAILLSYVLSNFVYPLFQHVENNVNIGWIGSNVPSALFIVPYAIILFSLIAYYVLGKNKPYWMNPKNLGKGMLSSSLTGLFLFAVSTIGGYSSSFIVPVANAGLRLQASLLQYQTYIDVYKKSFMKEDLADGYYELQQFPIASNTCKQMKLALNNFVNSPVNASVDGALRKRSITQTLQSGCITPDIAFNMSKRLEDRVRSLQYGFEPALSLIYPNMKYDKIQMVDATGYTDQEWCLALMKTSHNQKMWDQCTSLNNVNVLKALPTETTAEGFYASVRS